MSASAVTYSSSLLALTAQAKARDVAKQDAELSDEALFEQARKGSRDALGLLVGRYERTLFALLVRLTHGDKHKADDLFQETFLRAMRGATTFNGKMPFKPWLTKIAVNLVRDDIRKRKVRSEVEFDSLSFGDAMRAMHEKEAKHSDPAERAQKNHTEECLHRALLRLTVIEHEVVLLHFFNSLTLAETADILEIPIGTVKSRLHAALTRLNGLLSQPDE